MPDEDKKLLSRLARDDHEAFRLIFIKYYPKLKSFITCILKDSSVAEELSQDIFLQIWERRSDLAEIKTFHSYIYRTAKNKALNLLEHKCVQKNYILNYKEGSVVTPDEILSAKELEFLIELVVDQMPEQRQKIYRMNKEENLNKEEIAEKLNIKKKTIDNQLSLALKEIRRALPWLILYFRMLS